MKKSRNNRKIKKNRRTQKKKGGTPKKVYFKSGKTVFAVPMNNVPVQNGPVHNVTKKNGPQDYAILGEHVIETGRPAPKIPSPHKYEEVNNFVPSRGRSGTFGPQGKPTKIFKNYLLQSPDINI